MEKWRVCQVALEFTFYTSDEIHRKNSHFSEYHFFLVTAPSPISVSNHSCHEVPTSILGTEHYKTLRHSYWIGHMAHTQFNKWYIEKTQKQIIIMFIVFVQLF